MRQVTIMLFLLVIYFSFCSISRAQSSPSYLDKENTRYRLFTRAVGPTVDVNGIRVSTLPYRSAAVSYPSNGPAITANTYNSPSYQTSGYQSPSNERNVDVGGLSLRTSPYGASVSIPPSNGPAIKASTYSSPGYPVGGNSGYGRNSYVASVSTPPSNGPAITASTYSSPGYRVGGNSGYGRNSYISSENKNINGQRSSTVRVVDDGQDTVYRYHG
ncbi:uncharacterized protein LOC142319357 [Lycorma delicatula]|uniref:uncharacterized protein LOC142319357 n=1 Tax=Lycorma delicatula TaxID=130591 RepID=UPI003F51973C